MRETEALALLRRHAIGGTIVFLGLTACIAMADRYPESVPVAELLQHHAACAEADAAAVPAMGRLGKHLCRHRESDRALQLYTLAASLLARQQANAGPHPSGTGGATLAAANAPRDRSREALRRLWAEDTAIRQFIEVAENQWDFAAGRDIPGFGALQAETDLACMLAGIVAQAAPRPPGAIASQPPSSLRTTEARLAAPPDGE